MALSDCSRQVSWICTIFLELGICLGPILIYADNQGSIFIGSNPVQEIHTKHIDVKYHYVCECIVDKQIVLYHVPTEDNTADISVLKSGPVRFFCCFWTNRNRNRFPLRSKNSQLKLDCWESVLIGSQLPTSRSQLVSTATRTVGPSKHKEY
jgi:hypothetical protein